jgi:SPP1 family phage portal protein
MTLEEVKAYIEYDRQERERRARMYRYYRTHNAILDEKQKGDDKPDNRLAHGFVSYICNAFAGYMFGKPVTYSPLSEEGETDEATEALAEAVDACFKYNDEQAENTVLGLDCAICGVGVEILYVDADAAVRFGRVDPVGCIAVRDGSIENALTALIRYYDRYNVVTKQTTRTVEVYEKDAITVYRSIGGDLATFGEPEETAHYFGDVPAVVYENNLFGMGDAEGVLSLVDAYDRMQSDGLNDQQYFTDAYLAMYGVGDMENAKEMRRNRLLLMPEGSRAEWLTKQQSDATPQNIKNRLNDDIHRFSACPDMSDDQFAGNASGVALSYKLLQFENVAGIKEREFKRGLQRRLELLCNFWRVKGLPTWDWRRLKISFHRALPQNLLELSQVVGNLSDVVSDETKRELLPLDIDEATEKQRLAEQYGDSLFTPRERRTGEIDEPADGDAEEN